MRIVEEPTGTVFERELTTDLPANTQFLSPGQRPPPSPMTARASTSRRITEAARLGEVFANHVSLATAIWLQTMAPFTAGDTVEPQGYFRVADGYFAADQRMFWGCKVG